MQIKKQQLDLDMDQWSGSKLRKEYVKAVYCHPVSLTYMQSLSCEAGIKIARRNINNFRYGNDTILMAESEEKLTLFNIISWLKSQRSKN